MWFMRIYWRWDLCEQIQFEWYQNIPLNGHQRSPKKRGTERNPPVTMSSRADRRRWESPQDQAFPSELSLNKVKPAIWGWRTVFSALLLFCRAQLLSWNHTRKCSRLESGFSPVNSAQFSTKPFFVLVSFAPSRRAGAPPPNYFVVYHWILPGTTSIPSRPYYLLEVEQLCVINATLHILLYILIKEDQRKTFIVYSLCV